MNTDSTIFVRLLAGVVAACFCNLSLYGALETCLDCQAGLDPSILDVAQKTTDSQ